MLAATVREAARRFGELTAFVDPDGSPLSYRELDRRSDAVAAALAARGVAEGDRVVLRLPSDSRYVVAYAAAAKLGAVTAGINPHLARPEQEALVDLADPALVVAEGGEVDDLVRDGAVLAGRDGPPPALPADPRRPAAIVFTSGTTGRPKGALFCERQLEAVAATDTGGAWAPKGRAGPAMLASTQFAHVGFTTKLPWYLRLASRTHILGRWRADDALRTIAAERMPSIGGVAPQLALMVRSPEAARHDWRHVTTVVAGGAASPPALVAAVRERFGAAYSIRYSSTESGGCGTGTAFEADDDEALLSVGRPRPGVEVAVRDSDGRPAPTGEVGELWLRSPTQMSGYWRDPEATAATLVGGWLRTGDLARIDERSLVRLAGRAKEMFVRGGYNVYPAEVEAALAAHPAVTEVAVVPRPDPVMGEVGVAVVVPLDPAAPPPLADLRAFLADRLAAYKAPEAVRIVDELPLTPMQKVDRRALAAREASGGGR
ncbi:MAG TPA: AMP-binding protein [Acidimicrobiales bacterium]|nr:AMP-binding protein [Acidimicrobiales bacterium]